MQNRFKSLLKACAFALPLTTMTPMAQADDGLNKTQEQRVQELVRETLLTNPEILMEAMQILQERQEQAKAAQQRMTLATVKDAIIDGPLTPKSGNLKGDVTMIEFFDYNCGYCKRVFPGVMEVIKTDGNIRFVSKEFAILGPGSEAAARAALAAELQGKYMEMHVALMEIRGRIDEAKVLKTAEKVGLDMEKLKEDMKSDKVTAEINSTRDLARGLNITGTPAFIIGDQIIPGAVPPEALKEVIAEVRKQKS